MKKHNVEFLPAANMGHQINLIVLATRDWGRLLAMYLNLCNI